MAAHIISCHDIFGTRPKLQSFNLGGDGDGDAVKLAVGAERIEGKDGTHCFQFEDPGGFSEMMPKFTFGRPYAPRGGKSRASALITFAGLALAICGFGTTAHALECPAAHPFGGRGVIKESRQQIASLSSTFRHQGGAALPRTVAVLRRRYPTASNGEILNYLVTAYCPVVASQSGKSERQKEAGMKRFNQKAREVIYR